MPMMIGMTQRRCVSIGSDVTPTIYVYLFKMKSYIKSTQTKIKKHKNTTKIQVQAYNTIQ